ncbi:hypothetical protein IP87_01615 [beta proteobacterium AAP121]|nr:hypothetical protein IP80_02385 [beta proteobacterium AAP65]KPG00700.1 hypothetical protein IP87_01615 [beta proteobacterium AAP121]
MNPALKPSICALTCAAALLLAACGGGDGEATAPPSPPPAPPPVNRAPVAEFTAPATVVQGQGVLLDGSTSSDPDNDALTLDWQFGNGERAGGARVAQVFNEPGSYTVRLVATDPAGLQSSRERTITVNPAPAAAVTGSLAVLVTDADGAPVADAAVRLGSQTVQSDADGLAPLTAVPLGVPLVVSVQKAGLLEAALRTRIDTPADGSAAAATLQATLPAEAAARAVDLSAAVDITDSAAGLRVQVPAGALRRPDGSTATGAATLRITPVPTGAAAPFGTGTVDATGTLRPTLALAPVKLRFEQAGQALDLAPGRTARLSWTVPASPLPDGSELRAGLNLGLHALDTRSGLWREEGRVSVLAGSAAGTVVLQADVSHFSYWDARYGAWVFNTFNTFNPGCIAAVGALPANTVCVFRVRLVNPRWAAPQPEALSTFEWNDFFYFDNGRWLQRYQVPSDFAGVLEAYAYNGFNIIQRGEQAFAAGQLRGTVNVRLSPRPISPRTVLLNIDGGNADASGNTATRDDVRLVASVQSDSLFERVEFTLGGQLVATDSQAPFEANLALAGLADGEYSVLARAVRGNTVLQSAARNLRIDRAAPAPTVTYGSGAGLPLSGATQVGLASVLRVNFNERMQPASVAAAAFTLSPPVPGSWALDAEERTATFTPTTTWALNTAYTLTVQGALDRAGNSLSAQLASFSTEAPAAARSWGAQNALPPASANRQLTVGQGGTVLSFVQPGVSQPYRLFLRRDGEALSYTDAGEASAAATANARAAVSGAHAALAWREATGSGNTLHVTRIHLGGATPTFNTEAVATLSQPGDNFDVAVNSNGDVVLAYTVGNLNQQAQVFARRYRSGAWENPTRLDGGRVYLNHLLTALADSGDALVTWFDRAAPGDAASQFVATHQVAGAWQALQVVAGGYNRLSLDDVRLRGDGGGTAVLGFGYTPSNARGQVLEVAVFRPASALFTRSNVTDRVVGWDLALGSDGTAHVAYSRTAASNNSAVGRVGTLHLPATGNPTAYELASYSGADLQLDNGIRHPALAVNGSGTVMVGGGRSSLGRAPFYLGTAGAGFSAIGEAAGTYANLPVSTLFLDAAGQALFMHGLRFQLYR